jgi:hypothetical protein
MNPDDIRLEGTSKLFLYEKLSREMESITNLSQLRQMARCFLKLYLKQQEVLAAIGIPQTNNDL